MGDWGSVQSGWVGGVQAACRSREYHQQRASQHWLGKKVELVAGKTGHPNEVLFLGAESVGARHD